MGPICCIETSVIDKIDSFMQEFGNLDSRNSIISEKMIECTLHEIGQIGFEKFCELKLKYIKVLYLGNNEIANITFLENCDFPHLEKLSLDRNKIKNVDVFEKVKYPLEYLDLTYNMINDISIFAKEKTLPNLKKLLLSENDFNSKDEKTQNILSNIKEKINKNKNSELEYSDDPSYQSVIKKINTINDKYINESQDKIGIFDKNIKQSLHRIKTQNNLNEEDGKEIDNLIPEITNIKKLANSPDDNSEDNNNEKSLSSQLDKK